jgi:hypothetical protein
MQSDQTLCHLIENGEAHQIGECGIDGRRQLKGRLNQ